ncbi:MAG: alpha/beta hydrolase [Planctomycetaceae bacterium]|jgi:pimeloyl-ACP methyl ester carboxylesterase|nr:alpha/beta hydrolase [Planctomycetaceae bacterium]
MFRINFLILVLFCGGIIFGQSDGDSVLRRFDERVPIRTGGGYLFWGDVLFFHDWHIQKNVKFNSYRLIDGNAVQRAFGTFEECKTRLDEIQEEAKLQPMSGNILIVVHGFGSSGHRTKRLAEWFGEQKIYDHVINFTYPSTSQSILEHARMLDGVIRNLSGAVRRIDFVAHSLGCIVVRRYLSGVLDEKWVVAVDPLAERDKFTPDVRIGRFVMLGPPNNGAELASKMIGESRVVRPFTGPTGDELGLRWDETKKMLGIPKCEFAIIAGGRGNDRGFSRMIKGDDDGIVSVEGTKLSGAAEWVLFYMKHDDLLKAEVVFEYALEFLKKGTFRGIAEKTKIQKQDNFQKPIF